MRVSKLTGVLAGVTVLAMGVTVAAQRGETGTQRQTQQTQQQRQAQPRSSAEQARNEVCPAGIPDLQVEAEQMENGGALVLTTSETNQRQLRDRLNRFVQMHEQQMQQRHGTTGMQQREGTQAQRQQQQQQQQRRFADQNALIHQGRAEMIEIPNGAILLFSMESTERVSDLQNELRQDAQALEQGRCPLSLQLESA